MADNETNKFLADAVKKGLNFAVAGAQSLSDTTVAVAEGASDLSSQTISAMTPAAIALKTELSNQALQGNSDYTDGSNILGQNIYLELYSVPFMSSVVFKAYITDFEDAFESTWESEQLFGRNDPIEVFVGTKRTIRLGWKVVAANVAEAESNLNKINTLMGFLYPAIRTEAGSGVFAGVSSMIAAPIMKLKFGNLIKSQQNTTPDTDGETSGATREFPYSVTKGDISKAQLSGLAGRVGGFAFRPVLDDGFFDPEPGKLLPKTVELNCDFTVYHSHTLGQDINVNNELPGNDAVGGTSHLHDELIAAKVGGILQGPATGATIEDLKEMTKEEAVGTSAEGDIAAVKLLKGDGKAHEPHDSPETMPGIPLAGMHWDPEEQKFVPN